MKKQHTPGTHSDHSSHELAEQILDMAIRLAKESSWESLRLHQVAQQMGISLEKIHLFYAQKDDLVEAWYDRADRAMLADAALEDYQWLTPRERIHRSVMCWLTSMQNQRRVSRDMLMYKFELGHLHLQVLGLLRISRTVQWILESAGRKTVHLQRVTEEMAVTGIYLSTFAHWLFDDSNGAEKTRRFLDHLLRRAESLARLIPPLGLQGCSQSRGTHGSERSEPHQSVEGAIH